MKQYIEKLWQVANTFEDDALRKTLFAQVNKNHPPFTEEKYFEYFGKYANEHTKISSE